MAHSQQRDKVDQNTPLSGGVFYVPKSDYLDLFGLIWGPPPIPIKNIGIGVITKLPLDKYYKWCYNKSMEKHKKYIVFGRTLNYEIVAEFDRPEEVQTFILEGGYNIHDLLVAEFLPINITIGYPYEEL